MRPFYGIDIKANKGTHLPEGLCFKAAEISGQAAADYERAKRAAVELVRQVKPRGIAAVLLRIVAWICRILSSLTALFGVSLLMEKELGAFFICMMAALFLFAITCAASIVLDIMKKKRIAVASEDGSVDRCNSDLDAAIARIHQELEIPEGTREVDVIQMEFRWKKDHAQAYEQDEDESPYCNVALWAFRKGENLCFATMQHRYELPIRQMCCLRHVHESLSIREWNKDQPHNAPCYEQYHLKKGTGEHIIVNDYGLLELVHNDEEWAVWLPPYEIEYISQLTGIPVTEMPKKKSIWIDESLIG